MKTKFALGLLFKRRPSLYGAAYLVLIFVFSVLYYFLFRKSFNVEIDFSRAVYFSVVTSTTLGYGDIQPALDNKFLLATIALQAISGILVVGMFLNSVAQKISDAKDDEYKKLENEKYIHKQRINLLVLKPLLKRHFETLARCYKVTYKEAVENTYTEYPAIGFFDERVCAQLVHINFASDRTQFGKIGRTLGDITSNEFLEFKKGVDDFIGKFSYGMDVEILELVINIKNHRFLIFPKLYSDLVSAPGREKLIDFGENRYWGLLKRDEAVSILESYFSMLSKLLLSITRFDAEQIPINIELRSDVAPPVGSAYMA